MSMEHGRRQGDDGTITPYRDGPYLVRGPVRIVDEDGREIEKGRGTVALCRCGRSRIPPFCDGTHSVTGFRAPSRGPRPGPRAGGAAGAGSSPPAG